MGQIAYLLPSRHQVVVEAVTETQIMEMAFQVVLAVAVAIAELPLVLVLVELPTRVMRAVIAEQRHRILVVAEAARGLSAWPPVLGVAALVGLGLHPQLPVHR
jgi:hypothetical protein